MDMAVEAELVVEEIMVIVVEEPTKKAMAEEAEEGIHPLVMFPQRSTPDSHQISD